MEASVALVAKAVEALSAKASVAATFVGEAAEALAAEKSTLEQ